MGLSTGSIQAPCELPTWVNLCGPSKALIRHPLEADCPFIITLIYITFRRCFYELLTREEYNQATVTQSKFQERAVKSPSS